MLHFFAKRLKQLHEVERDERGFTLIELIVVVVIIGILAAIAIPVFLGQRADAADARAKANVREAASAVNVYFTEEGAAPGTDPDAGTLLAGYGFNGSDPDVSLTSAGGPADATWCVDTPTDGGTVASWYMDETQPSPQAGTCP